MVAKTSLKSKRTQRRHVDDCTLLYAEILEGYVESFRATVSDDDNEYAELTVAWYVGDEIVCDWTTLFHLQVNPFVILSLNLTIPTSL